MFLGRRPYPTKAHFKRKRIRLLNKSFQLKYTVYMLGIVCLAIVLFGGPVLYYLNQNYNIFMDLAYDQHSTLIEHLEREVIWLNAFILIGGIGVLCGCVFLGFQVTTKMVGPIFAVESHLKKLTKGYWAIPELKGRHGDEFKDFVNTYSYFYKSLRANTEAEIKLLKKLSIDPNNREAYTAWKELIRLKSELIGLRESSIETASSSPSRPDSLRAS
jgi:hypothetical protein